MAWYAVVLLWTILSFWSLILRVFRSASVSRAGDVTFADPVCKPPRAVAPRGQCSDPLRKDGIERVRPALGVLRVHSRRADTAHATADESKGITGSLQVQSLSFT